MTEASPIERVAVRGADVRGDETAANRPGAAASGISDALADAGLEVVDRADADAVVAVGEAALTAAASSEPAVPLLPVGVDRGLHSVARNSLAGALAALAAGEYRTATHPVLGIDHGGESAGRAVFDVTLMTTEPARISEYSLTSDGEVLNEVRADGMVVAASYGSAGYTDAAGGPLLAPGAGLSVVPVGPFTTRAKNWVVPGPLELAVERDEGSVSLFADESDLGEVPPHEPVRISVDGEFVCLRPTLE